ncbi:putative phospholipid ABC transporter-binding protein MlaD [Actinomadura rubteroloni]|uniref:Putative phospholipid ABC transporter-binding protein MlaD n=1 Tax=Actinomadura rubteroloni TaxID=1926885 RepID=A0A2P4UQS3_9ACTN|nr:MCE family protein [Actinomadura rubteroloni]POM27390.1 putative phospholipid ABC transporter-binding protein MlaD [Actinomadura rubteroloni]
MASVRRRRPGRRTAVAGLAGVLAAGALSGCNLNVQSMPLPGGADVGSDPYTVTATFANVLNLVPQSSVKVNDVAVGRVTKVSLPSDGWNARVTMLINRKVKLPANAYAQLQQSSLLGEKYISLSPPTTGATGALGDHGSIPVERTNRNPEVEEVLGALSMLLNGGGIAQIRTITKELNNALTGNAPQVRSLLERLNTLSGNLNSNRANITAALDGLARLSSTMGSRTKEIGTVLDDLAPGLKVLEEQRGQLVEMLGSLDKLSSVAVRTLNASKEDIVADLKALDPVVRKLADSGRDLPRALQVLLTFPFTDQVAKAVKGDYLNVYLHVTAQPGTELIPPLTPPKTSEGDGGTAAKPTTSPTLPLPATGEGN